METLILGILFLNAFMQAIFMLLALFIGIVGGCLAYQFGLKLREFKPKAFLLEDIVDGAYELKSNRDGSVDLVLKEEKEDVFAEDHEEALKWMYGA